MKNINHILALFFSIIFFNCGKKTTIDAKVYNYALAEPVPNVVVVLVERRLGGVFSKDASCKEIAKATTDESGNCCFENERLKNTGSKQYFLAVANAYGKTQNYPCGGKTSGFLKAGTNYNEILDVGAFESFLEIKINGALNPSLLGDSLNISIVNPIYKVPGQPYAFGGGGVASGGYSTESPNYPFPSIISWPIQKTNAGKNTVHIRKRKMGVLTTYVDTVKIYPYETKIIEVNW